ncbi:hypothetical protein E2C01_074432 [Portunus trituberculatus]|uniref:Uncharacterized protein n=1 Tax=Portunus trituberculatus TaxID=210409 RepID=A0A5B7IDH9_PORTR|nr:hypothetical protein [Portunus trituberculatus]
MTITNPTMPKPTMGNTTDATATDAATTIPCVAAITCIFHVARSVSVGVSVVMSVSLCVVDMVNNLLLYIRHVDGDEYWLMMMVTPALALPFVLEGAD